jgi:DNA-binding response OmpR family regulator
MARVKVVIERSGLKTNKEKDSYSYQGISLDVAAHVVTVDGELVHLTNKEFELLKYFLQNPNIVISRNTLLENIWGYDFYGVDRTVDTHIKMLRKNLGPYGTLIKTIRGEGYKFDQV